VLPTLQIGPLSLPTYPLALLIGGWLALEIAARAARSKGLDGDAITNAAVFALLAGLAAGRLAHVIAYWPAYRTQPLEIIGLSTSAFLLLPAAVAAAVVVGWTVRRHGLPVAATLDAFALGGLAGLAVISFGAFLAGRNPGAPSDLPWAVTVWGAPRHPVQLYEMAGYLAALALAWRAFRSAAAPGTAALIAAAGWGLTRWLFEPFHASSTTAPGGLRLAQIVGLAAALAALWALGRRSTARQG
jgi:phosphatidylglycerol:prolipoprotein diacylglycerol transferase